MKAPTFSLRFLFVLTAGVAVICYFCWPQSDGITEGEATAIHLGMFQENVRATINAMPAASRTTNGGVCWWYRVKSPLGFEPGELVIEFQPPDGRVVKISRKGRAGFAFPK